MERPGRAGRRRVLRSRGVLFNASQTTHQVKVQAFPQAAYNDAALGLFARRSALDAAGVRVATVDQPWTAQEFTQALEKIKASGKFSYVLDLGTGDPVPEWWTYAYSPFSRASAAT